MLFINKLCKNYTMTYSSKLFNLKNKKIVLTGCFGLLGREFKDYLLKNGALVIGIDLKSEKKFKNHKNFFFYQLDLTKPNSIKETCNKINKKFKKIDCLINNAAINETIEKNYNNNFLNFEIKKFDLFSDVNIKAILYLSKYFHKTLKKGKGGSIINIGSVYGVVSPNQKIYNKDKKIKNQKNISYTITKSSLIGLTKHLAVIFAKDKIRVNSTSFGGVKNFQSKDFLYKYSKNTPMNRLAKKNEFNGLINFLISDASSYVTGSNIIVDGGLTII